MQAPPQPFEVDMRSKIIARLKDAVRYARGDSTKGCAYVLSSDEYRAFVEDTRDPSPPNEKFKALMRHTPPWER